MAKGGELAEVGEDFCDEFAAGVGQPHVSRMATQKSANGARKSNGASAKKNGAGANRAATSGRASGPPAETTTETAASYDAPKEFHGQRYTGMKVGRGHRWKYDPGVWVEKKVTPDKWEFRYDVVKRRSGKAPEGSGVPPGTAYHWYILAHQTATKCDANNYETSMVGLKYKLAHKRADKSSWSASDRAQTKQLVKLLRQLADELEADPETAGAPAAEATRATPAGAHENGKSKPAASSAAPKPRTRKASAANKATTTVRI